MPIYRIEGPEGQTYEIEGPEGATREQVIGAITEQLEAQQNFIEPWPTETPAGAAPVERSFLRETADIPLKAGEGVVAGVRMLADAFGANNPVSQNLRSVENYIAELYSAQSKADSQRVAEIMKAAEDEGVLANVKAAFEAFSVAPVDLLVNALGTSAPTILGGLGAGALKAGAMGVRAAQAGIGATTGAGVTKGAIYEAVKEELQGSDLTPEQIEQKAQLAQSYNGENLDQILMGTGIGAVAGSVGIEPTLAGAATRNILQRSALKQAGAGAIKEGGTEFIQGGQEQLAQNIALQREGFDVPTMRGVVGAGTLEGLAGAALGAPISGLNQRRSNIQAEEQEFQEQVARDNELAAIQKERRRIAGIAAAERQAQLDREAELRRPLGEQLELDLTPETTVEEVAERRVAESPQGDLFAGMPEAAPVTPTQPRVSPQLTTQGEMEYTFPESAPEFTPVEAIPARRDYFAAQGDLFVDRAASQPIIATPELMTSLFPKLAKGSKLYKKYINADLSDPETFEAFSTLAEKYGRNNPINETAMEELQNAVSLKSDGDVTPGPSGVSPTVSDAGRPVEATGATQEPDLVTMDDAGDNAGLPARRAVDEYAALEPQAELEPAQEVLPAEAEPVMAEEAPRLTPEERQHRIVARRAEEEAARREEREAAQSEAIAEQRGRSPSSELLPAEIEGLEAAREAEADDAEFETAKGTAGAFIRQTFGGAQNIAPEERVTLPQFLAALADIMYHIVRKGITSRPQAIQEAKKALGNEANKVNDFQLNKAFADATTRVAQEQAAQPEQRELREPSATTNPELEAESDALLAAAGGSVDAVVKSSPFQAYKDDPKAAAKDLVERSKDYLKNVETRWFSSNAKLNGAIRKAMEDAGESWDKTREALYAITDSQATHGENVAHQVLAAGNIEYDSAARKFVATEDVEGSWKMAVDTVNAAAAKYGIDPNKMIAYAHQAFVAQRLEGAVARNAEIEARAVALDEEGKKAQAEALRDNQVFIHLDDSQRQAALEFLTKFPELNTAFDQWNKTRANILAFAVDTGLYSQEDAEVLLNNMDYVPFYRVDQLDNQAGPKEYSRGLLDASKDKKFKGSEQEVNNVFDNMERWISYTVRKGINNNAAKNLAQFAVDYMPDEVREVEKTNRNMRQNTIGVWVDGERQLYEFDDPFFIDAFTGLEPVALPALQFATKVANVLRQNIVLNPLFSLGQLPQDAFGAMFASGVKSPFAIPMEVAKEFVKTMTGTSEAHRELMRYGAAGQRDYSAVMSRIAAEEAEGLRAPSSFDKLLSPLRKVATASDNAVRQAVYNQTMKESGDKALAIERAFEIINFRRSGSNPYISVGRQVIPFFGAYLQAMNVVQKTLLGKGIAPTERADAMRVWTNTIPKVIALSLMYSMLMGDDDDYQKDDPVTRARKLYVPGTGLTLPLRPDMFTFIAKVIPEQLYMNVTDEMTMDGTATRRALGDAFVNAVAGPTAVPQIIKPLVEVSLNRNFFTGRPIVGQGLQYLDKPEQYSFNTSEFSKVLGSTGLISPVVADHIIRSYTGYTGGMFMLGIDAAINAGQDSPKPEASGRDFIASIPGMSQFVSREEGNKLKTEFYGLREQVNTAVNTYNRLRDVKPEKARAYREENKELLRVKTQVNRINKQLADIRKIERRIREFPRSRMSPEQKQEAIDKLRAREKRMLANISRLRQQAGL